MGDSDKKFPLWVLITSLTSCCVLLAEVLFFQYLMFLSDYLSANFVISVALLGLAVGAIIAGFYLSNKNSSALLLGAKLLPAGVLASLIAGMLLPDMYIAIGLVMILPFAAASLILSTLISIYPSHKVYAADLVGAGLGAILGVILIPLVREEGTFLILFALALCLIPLVSESFSNSRPALKIAAPIILCLAVALAFINSKLNFFNLDWSVRPTKQANKVFSRFWDQFKKEEPHKIVASEGSLVERIDMMDRGGFLVTYFNAYGNDRVIQHKYNDSLFVWDRRVPIGLVKYPTVLIVGTSAEGVTKTSKLAASWPDGDYHGKVVGIEINPAIVKAMLKPKIYEYSKEAYEGIELYVMDARSFLARDKRKFDLITCMNTHRIHHIGFIGPPEYLHTYEGLKLMLDHLTDRGIIVLEERALSKRASYGIARFLVTAKEVLRNEYNVPYSEFPNYVIVYHWWFSDGRKNYIQILLKRNPFTQEELDYLKQWKEGLVPTQMRERQLEFYHFPNEAPKKVYGKVVVAQDPYDVLEKSKFVMDPVYDDKPFPYDVFRNRKEHVNLIIYVVALSAALVLIPAFIIIRKLRKAGQITKIKKFSIISIYLFVLGFAYLLIEIVLMQKFQIFLNSPVYSFAIVLGTMLIASGIGSKVAERLGTKGIIICLIALLVILGIVSAKLGPALESLIYLPFGIRILIAIAIVGAIAFFMGMPFPWGISRIRASSGNAAGALGFGLNGAAGAIATPVALLTSTTIGFSQTYFLGAFAYLLCALLIPFMLSKKPTSHG